MKRELVKDWMSTDVVVLRIDGSLPEAHQIMISKNIRRLPVTDENGRLAGIITLGDVRSVTPSPASSVSIFERNYLLSNLEIERVMTRNPITIHPNQTIDEAAKTMLQERISGLPVLDDDGRICGIITESDIFRMVVMHEWGSED